MCSLRSGKEKGGKEKSGQEKEAKADKRPKEAGGGGGARPLAPTPGEQDKGTSRRGLCCHFALPFAIPVDS